MALLSKLKKGDQVEVIAPASRCSQQDLTSLLNLLKSWQLNCIVSDDIFGDDILCANSDERRFYNLKNALENEKNKAIICVRGGYGSSRLIPKLMEIKRPQEKIFIGMSDITALHLFFQQVWNWTTIHASCSPNKLSTESIKSLETILFVNEPLTFQPLQAMNQVALTSQNIKAPIIGGNLTLVQAGIGTSWGLKSNNKIVFLEEINERGYRVDRMLEHLNQANLLDSAQAILLGDFLGGQEPSGVNLTDKVLKRFADNCSVPVLKINGIGHGSLNYPIPLGFPVELHLSQYNKMIVSS